MPETRRKFNSEFREGAVRTVRTMGNADDQRTGSTLETLSRRR